MVLTGKVSEFSGNTMDSLYKKHPLIFPSKYKMHHYTASFTPIFLGIATSWLVVSLLKRSAQWGFENETSLSRQGSHFLS